MSYDPLVSESESSSGASSPTHPTQSLSDSRLTDAHSFPRQIPVVKSEASSPALAPLRLPSKQEQGSSREGTPNIQNEDLPGAKLTLSASMVLSKLAPDSSRVITKVSEPINEKITIRCQPIGSAPELTPNVFKISYHQPFATLIKFLNKKLRKKLPNKGDTIYLYVNNSFSPSPDEIIGQLHRHFAANGELVVSYCMVVAFG